MLRKKLQDECYIFVFKAPALDFIHMLFMRFAIDIVWLDCDKKVIGLFQNAKPWQRPIHFPGPSRYIIEATSGIIKKFSIKKGDKLTF